MWCSFSCFWVVLFVFCCRTSQGCLSVHSFFFSLLGLSFSFNFLFYFWMITTRKFLPVFLPYIVFSLFFPSIHHLRPMLYFLIHLSCTCLDSLYSCYWFIFMLLYSELLPQNYFPVYQVASPWGICLLYYFPLIVVLFIVLEEHLEYASNISHFIKHFIHNVS